jgi:predicted nucleic acid-binding protein
VTRLFDSTILISHLRGDRRATDLLLEATSTGALASVVSRAEIEGGMRSGERADVSRLFEGLRLIPVTDAAARRPEGICVSFAARTPASTWPTT